MTKQLHKYEYEVKPNSAAAKVVRLVGSGRRVLELGSGPGMITRLLKANNCHIVALELDEKAIEIVSQFCDQVHRCNLNDSDWPSKVNQSEKFEVIVAGDVLEHLYDPWTTLSNLQPLLASGGSIVLSLPHVGHNAVIACLMAGDFGYQPWGLLDKTHIRFFGIANIQQLFDGAGFKIVEVDYVIKSPEQTEFAQRWRQLSPAAKQAISANRFGNVYQVVVKAVPMGAPGRALQLVSEPIPLPVANAYSAGAKGSRFLAFLISFLSLQTRQRIAQGLRRIGFRF